ncbi:hypothetical protein E8E13_006991 [Curvularia kusanoi]|uniref:Uncharacterized protein n=1 Tax=Curvularia kusanoi TaxID=90978 RepID=A0A9P4TBP9_CURKU|nr:hypothetical protein E8E13_006991 [Curvularia kusanoi]
METSHNPRSDLTLGAQSRQRFTVRKVLVIHATVWEALLESRSRSPLLHAGVRGVSPPNTRYPGAQVWILQVHPSRTVSGYIHSGDSDLAFAERALAKKNQCDFFCMLFEEAIRAKLQEFQLGTCQWVWFKPKVPSVFLESNMAEPSESEIAAGLLSLPPVSHSVLEIRPRNDVVLVLDGTAAQFGWAGQIHAKQEVEQERQASPGMEKVLYSTKLWLELYLDWNQRMMKRKLEGYLGELNWAALAMLEEPDLSEVVFAEAATYFSRT